MTQANDYVLALLSLIGRKLLKVEAEDAAQGVVVLVFEGEDSRLKITTDGRAWTADEAVAARRRVAEKQEIAEAQRLAVSVHLKCWWRGNLACQSEAICKAKGECVIWSDNGTQRQNEPHGFMPGTPKDYH